MGQNSRSFLTKEIKFHAVKKSGQNTLREEILEGIEFGGLGGFDKNLPN